VHFELFLAELDRTIRGAACPCPSHKYNRIVDSVYGESIKAILWSRGSLSLLNLRIPALHPIRGQSQSSAYSAAPPTTLSLRTTKATSSRCPTSSTPLTASSLCYAPVLRQTPSSSEPLLLVQASTRMESKHSSRRRFRRRFRI
jgi:hypothetical protein